MFKHLLRFTLIICLMKSGIKPNSICLSLTTIIDVLFYAWSLEINSNTILLKSYLFKIKKKLSFTSEGAVFQIF